MAAESADRPSVVFASVLGAALWRHRWLIAVSTILAGVAGFYVSSTQPNTWTAQSRLVLATTQNFDPLGGGGGSVAPGRFIANQIEIIQSRPVLEIASGILQGGSDAGELRGAITVTAPADSDILEISSDGSTPQEAAARADAVAAAYQQFVLVEVQQSAAQAEAAVAADPEAVTDVRTEAAVYGDGVTVVEAASPPSAPTTPRPRRDALLLALLAAFATAGVALWRRDGQKQHDGEALAEQMGAPLLGVVQLPVERGRLVRPADGGFDMALVALDYSLAGHPGPVLVTGLERESGAAALTLGLAAAAARNRRVLVVDADVDDRMAVALCDVDEPGTAIEELADDAGVDTLVTPVPLLSAPSSASFDLAVLGRGVLGRSSDVDRARRNFGLLNGRYDLVLVHAGPLSTDAVAFSLLREVGSVVVAGGGTGRYEVDAFVPATRHVLSLAGRSCDGLVLTTTVKKRRGQRSDTAVTALPPERARDEVPSTTVTSGRP